MNKFLGNMSYPIYHNRQKIGLRPIFWRSIDCDVLFQTLLYLYFIVVLYIKFNALNFFEIKKNLYRNKNKECIYQIVKGKTVSDLLHLLQKSHWMT